MFKIVAMYLREMTQLSTPARATGPGGSDGSARTGRPPVAAWATRSYSFRIPVNFMLNKERLSGLGGFGPMAGKHGKGGQVRQKAVLAMAGGSRR